MENPFRRELRRLPAPGRTWHGQSDRLNTSVPQQLVTLLVDTSSSMAGPPIHQVNRGAARFASELADDALTRETVRVQLVTFGQTVEVRPFAPIARFAVPILLASGFTPMAEAILKAIQETERQVEFLDRAAELDVLKPHYFLFSDGAPTSPPELLREAAAAVHQRERLGLGAFYAFGVDQAAVMALQSLFPRRVHILGERNFADFFHVVSVSVRRVSSTSVGEEIDLSPIIGNLLRLPHRRDPHA